jgi:hypothetical protein
MNNTENLFNALVKNDEVAAFEAFKGAIEAKLQTTLDVKKVGLTSDIFGESTSHLDKPVSDVRSKKNTI